MEPSRGAAKSTIASDTQFGRSSNDFIAGGDGEDTIMGGYEYDVQGIQES